MAIIAIMAISLYCKKENNATSTSSPNQNDTAAFSSLSSFYANHASLPQSFEFNAAIENQFTTVKGTKIKIPANAFVDQFNQPVSGMVKLEFKDVYAKSDMLFSGLSTTYLNANPLKSAGMFFIKATQNNVYLLLAKGKSIEIKQPANGTIDPDMNAFVLDSTNGWNPIIKDSSNFLLDSFSFDNSDYTHLLNYFYPPYYMGTYINCDNSAYFANKPYTKLTVTIPDSLNTLGFELHLNLKSVSTLIHIYSIGSTTYQYLYAPLNMEGTLILVGMKNKKVYASFTPITITPDATINLTVTETTFDDVKSKILKLDD